MNTHLELEALPHPDPQVRRLGFDLSHPYVEQCWAAVIGPSGIAILRRLPVLWTQNMPARIPADDFAGSLGLGHSTGENGRFYRALDRLTQFRLAEWLEPGQTLGVYTEVPPLSAHQVARQPEWTRAAHEHLLGGHLDHIASGQALAAQVTEITSRLDRLEHKTPEPLPATRALGR
jgi:hypothetical protein